MPLPLANPPAQLGTTALRPAESARIRILTAPAPLRLWHLSSLDAPTVAVVWSLGFAWTAGVRLPHWVPLLLALGTWAVYIGDRLLDARSGIRSGALHTLRDRHFFHWRHRRRLAPVAIGAAVAAAIIIFACMPPVIRTHNSVLAAAALAYFSGVHARRPLPQLFFFTKEFLVGTLFTAGCAVPVFSHWHIASAPPGPVPRLFILPVACFAALAWLNCHAIERWESGARSRVTVAAGLLSFACLLAAALLAPGHPRYAALLVAAAASSTLLILLDGLRHRLTPLALRAAADLVLLTPLFLLVR